MNRRSFFKSFGGTFQDFYTIARELHLRDTMQAITEEILSSHEHNHP